MMNYEKRPNPIKLPKQKMNDHWLKINLKDAIIFDKGKLGSGCHLLKQSGEGECCHSISTYS